MSTPSSRLMGKRSSSPYYSSSRPQAHCHYSPQHSLSKNPSHNTDKKKKIVYVRINGLFKIPSRSFELLKSVSNGFPKSQPAALFYTFLFPHTLSKSHRLGGKKRTPHLHSNLFEHKNHQQETVEQAHLRSNRARSRRHAREAGHQRPLLGRVGGRHDWSVVGEKDFGSKSQNEEFEMQ